MLRQRHAEPRQVRHAAVRTQGELVRERIDPDPPQLAPGLEIVIAQ